MAMYIFDPRIIFGMFSSPQYAPAREELGPRWATDRGVDKPVNKGARQECSLDGVNAGLGAKSSVPTQSHTVFCCSTSIAQQLPNTNRPTHPSVANHLKTHPGHPEERVQCWAASCFVALTLTSPFVHFFSESPRCQPLSNRASHAQSPLHHHHRCRRSRHRGHDPGRCRC